MNSFRCLRLSITARAEENISLPAYQGGALRGAFGYALRGVICVVRNKECPECLLRSKCVYSYAFETPPPTDSEILRKSPYVPHPFVLNPMTGETGLYEPGMRLRFGMTLVGDRAIEYVPYFVYAFMRMGEKGLGRGKGKFRVERISVSDARGKPAETIYENEKLGASRTILSSEDIRKVAETYPPDRISLEFMTPVRIRYRRRFCDDLQFHVLIRNLLRRLSSLLYFHCDQRSNSRSER